MKKTIKKALSALTALCLAVCLTAVTAPAYTDVYTVVKGDSLWKIAKENHTTVDNLREINSLEEDAIFPGQKLLIVKSVPLP